MVHQCKSSLGWFIRLTATVKVKLHERNRAMYTVVKRIIVSKLSNPSKVSLVQMCLKGLQSVL